MIALLAAALIAQASPQPAPPPRTVNRVAAPKNPASARVGGDLYAVHCISCHGARLQGTVDAPPLRGVGAAAVDWALSTGRMPLEVPGTEALPGPPAFSRAQIDALIAYVTSHGGGTGPPIPQLAPSSDLTRGRVLFEENCQACHGATAEGAIAGFGWLAPPLRDVQPEHIAEAVRIGPGIMPRFDEHAIPPRDLDALVAYVGTLRNPDDRGGYPMGSVGPVAEGLVAVVIGLGGTILLMLAVGTTTHRKHRDA